MVEITDKEFLDYIERYAQNKITMGQIVNELKSDYRTINNKLIELSQTNQDLYYKIITNHPYKEKFRNDIDFEALMIYIIKRGISTVQAEDIFNVSRRTIDRRANKIKITNPELYELFRICTSKNQKLLEKPEIQEKIDELEYKNVIIGERNEEREKFLLDIEKRYNDLILTGLTKEEAAKKMGYSRDYINNVLDELYRLEIEKNSLNTNKQKNFRESLSDITNYNSHAINKIVINQDEILNKNDNEAR